MKLKLKMIAAAVALLSATGAANAALQTYASGNGSLALYAFNSVTRDYYIRDLGFTINTFLPSGVTTLPGDGGVTGTRSPEAGLLLNAGNTANFADASFATWLSGQNAADIRWAVAAGDNSNNSGQQSTRRVVVSSMNSAETATNTLIDNFTASGNAGGLATLFGDATLSVTGAGAVSAFDNNFGFGADSLASLGDSAGLFYFARTAYAGSGNATPVAFANSQFRATITLESDGDIVYAQPPAAVPVPAALWLLGSGLFGLGAMARRRKAAAQA